jgi:hypothetical protein
MYEFLDRRKCDITVISGWDGEEKAGSTGVAMAGDNESSTTREIWKGSGGSSTTRVTQAGGSSVTRMTQAGRRV